MAKRSETPAERGARDRVKRRYDAQLSAVNDFFTCERRIEMMRADIATLEAEQGVAVGALANASSTAEAATVVGWSHAKVREVAARGKSRREKSAAEVDQHAGEGGA